MGFTSAADIHKKNEVGGRPGSRRSSSPGVFLSTHINAGKGQKGRNRYHLNLRFSPSVVAEARYRTGDRIVIDVDREALLLRVRRVPEGPVERTWGLSATDKSVVNSSLSVKMVWVPGFPSVKNATLCEYVIVDDSILIDIPKEAQWDTCARVEPHEEAGSRGHMKTVQ